MDLQFLSLEISNFGTYVKETFDLQALPIGLHFLRGINEFQPSLGANDAGKSSLFNALTWCIYGKTVEGLKNPDVAPWGKKVTTTVNLTIKVGKNPKTISRSISPNKLLIDDDATGQEQVEQLLGVSFEIFTHTILLGQRQPLFFDLKPSEKMRVFADALGLDRWVARSKAASEQSDVIQLDHVKLQCELSGVEATLEGFEPLIQENARKAKGFESDRVERLNAARGERTTLQENISSTAKRRATAELEQDGALTEAKALKEEVNKLKKKVDAFKQEQAQQEAHLASHKRELTKVEEELKGLEGAKVCPTCGQAIAKKADFDKHKKELQQQITAKKALINQLKAKLGEGPSPFEVKLKKAEADCNTFLTKADDAEAAFRLHDRTFNTLDVKIKTLQNVIKELENNHNPYQDQLRSLMKKKTALETDVVDLKEALLALERKLELTKFWVKGFKDVQLYVIEETLQELELVSNSMLADVGLEDWEIHYAVEKETQAGTVQRGLNVTILSPRNDKPVKWETWGGGVGQRLRIVGALALSDVLLNHAGINTNLEVLDEPLQHMSPEGVRSVVPFLAERAQANGKQIILVDHQVIPSSSFTSTITCVKDKHGISHLVVGEG